MGACWIARRSCDRALALQLQGDRLELFERGRRLRHEVGVAEQRDVLDRVRQSVRLALVRERLDGNVLVLVRDLAQVERGHDPALDEVAERVVGVREEVGPGAPWRRLEHRIIEIPVRDLLHGDVGALHRGAVVHDRLDHRGTGLVRPDDEIGVAGSFRHRGGRFGARWFRGGRFRAGWLGAGRDGGGAGGAGGAEHGHDRQQ